MKKRNEDKIFTLVCLALLTALQVVFARFLVIPVSESLRFSMSFIPVVIAARRFGVMGSVTVYALGDLIGAFAFPTTGGYLPFFTFTAALSGLIFGIFLSKKTTPVRIVFSVITSQLVCSLLLNSFFLHFYYDLNLVALLGSRAIQCLITGAVEIIFMFLFLEKINKAIKIPKR